MRVYIATDAEGCSGIFSLAQVIPGGAEYPYARRMMASDINAAARGAFNAGATQVIVNDGHNNGDNLLIDQLDERIDLISGPLRPLGMAQGAELGCDVALLVGYHRRKGGKGVISHSYAYGMMVEMKINGRIAAEHDLIGCCIGSFGIPVIFLSGDDQECAEARSVIPGLYTVETKVAISNNAAMCHHPARVAREIEKTVQEAIEGYRERGIRPMTVEGPVNIEVRYTAEVQAAKAAMAPGAVRVDEVTVRFEGPDYMSAYQSFMIGTPLAGGFRDDQYLYR